MARLLGVGAAAALFVLLAAGSAHADLGGDGCVESRSAIVGTTDSTLRCEVDFAFTIVCPPGFCATHSEECSISGIGMLGCGIRVSSGQYHSCGPQAGGCDSGRAYGVFQSGGSRTVSGTTACWAMTGTFVQHVTLGCEVRALQ